MLQEVFRIPTPWGTYPIFGYGLMMVIGFLCAVQLTKFLSRRSELRRTHEDIGEVFVNAALLALVAGVIGARLSHVLENLGEYTRADRSAWDNFLAMINIRSGGLTFYGGLLLAFPIVIGYGILKKVPIRRGMDVAAPAITLGLAFGRIGCFLNGCCYGAECTVPWSVEFPYYSAAYVEQFERGEITPPSQLVIPDGAHNEPRLVTKDELRAGYATHTFTDIDGHVVKEKVALDPQARAIAAQTHSRDLHPAQLYSAFNSFLITAILVAFFTLKPPPGRVMALMLMLEGTTRFLLELVRAEPPVLGPMSISMIIAIFLVVGGAIMWFAFGPRQQATVQAGPGKLATA